MISIVVNVSYTSIKLEKINKIDGGDGCLTACILKVDELYTLNG